mmetsp:Transcript_11106/g.25622  ORF Transcript_11106/g.25622 Transcript_11106/m.25622 type:complete len:321 (-) Transcript_11106:637-1599(-)
MLVAVHKVLDDDHHLLVPGPSRPNRIGRLGAKRMETLAPCDDWRVRRLVVLLLPLRVARNSGQDVYRSALHLRSQPPGRTAHLLGLLRDSSASLGLQRSEKRLSHDVGDEAKQREEECDHEGAKHGLDRQGCGFARVRSLRVDVGAEVAWLILVQGDLKMSLHGGVSDGVADLLCPGLRDTEADHDGADRTANDLEVAERATTHSLCRLEVLIGQHACLTYVADTRKHIGTAAHDQNVGLRHAVGKQCLNVTDVGADFDVLPDGIVQALDIRRTPLLHHQEGSQVRCVGGHDQDQEESKPQADDAPAQRLRLKSRLAHEE